MLNHKFPLPLLFFKKLNYLKICTFAKKRKKLDSEPEAKPQADTHALIPAQENKIIVYVKEAIHTVKSGTKKSYQDIKLYRKVLKQKNKNISLWTAYELHEIRRIKKEFFKVVPFTFFIVIPLAEILLPAYILLFPNAYPTHFLSSQQKKERIKKLDKRQYDAHKTLLEYLKSALIVNSADIHDLLEKDILKLRKLLEDNKQFIEKYLNLRDMDSDTLILFANYLDIEIITGTHLINEIVKYTIHLPRILMNILYFLTRSKKRIIWNYWFLNYHIKNNYFPLEYLKRKILIYQIENNIKHLKNQDTAFDQYGFDYASSEINPDFMLDFGRERGFKSAEEDDIEVEEFFKKNWIPYTKTPMTNTIYLWQSVLNYKIA